MKYFLRCALHVCTTRLDGDSLSSIVFLFNDNVDSGSNSGSSSKRKNAKIRTSEGKKLVVNQMVYGDD